MVPNINRNGRSFRGAGAYHLHDKGDARGQHPASSERVAWTATRNLVNDDPHRAVDEMWHTAEAATHLKRMNGRGQQGRKCVDPVKTVSLAWAPHQSPTREDMEAAADSFLKAMGWQEHQALLVCHTDTAHPHLHIILNRIHPETGIVLNDWRERQRSQRWADAHDREQGLILCHVRAEKYEKSRSHPGSRPGQVLQSDGMPYPYAKLAQEQERALDNALAAQAVQDQAEKDRLSERHREQRAAFLASGKAQFRAARQEAYRRVRDEFKPQWRAHFAHARDLAEDFAQRSEHVYAEAAQLAREGDHAAAAEQLSEFHEERDTAFGDLAAGRQALHEAQIETTRERQDEACRVLFDVRAHAFQEIKDRQKEERAEFRALQALREAGEPFDTGRYQQLVGDGPAANDTRLAAEVDAFAATEAGCRGSHQPEINPFTQQTHELFGAFGYHDPPVKAPKRDVSDIAAAGIGAAIEIGVRFMEGLFAAPSPREQAVAKAWAIREHHEAPQRAAAVREEIQRDEFIRHAWDAVQEAEAARQRGRMRDHDDRERERSRER